MRITLIGAALVAATIIIHAIGSTALVRYLGHQQAGSRMNTGFQAWRVLVTSVLILMGLHAVEIMLWASVYVAVLPEGELVSFEMATYFSFVTFTTLGYGDITLSEGWRVLSGIEALNGILLVGWSTAMLFAVVQRIWQNVIFTKHQQQ